MILSSFRVGEYATILPHGEPTRQRVLLIEDLGEDLFTVEFCRKPGEIGWAAPDPEFCDLQPEEPDYSI